jgi:Domain of Unknown Function (DUF1543)
MKLFVFYVGGDCGGSNIELHDIRFSVGETAEDCHDDLRRQWWGTPESLHLDCWGAVEHADGYRIELTATAPSDQPGKLFFVNLGGYDPRVFTELHRNILLIANDAAEAKAKALGKITGWAQPHKDNVLEIDKMMDVSDLLRGNGYFVTLTKAADEPPFQFVCEYMPIGR